MKVFLGGTCNESNWRDEYIERLDKEGYTSFNPVVDDWDDEAQALEEQAKKECDVLLFTITPKMSGVFSIAEVTERAIINPTRTIFNVIAGDGKYQFNQNQLDSLIAVGKLVTKYGGYFCSGLDSVVKALEFIGSAAARPGQVYVPSSGMTTPINKPLHNSDTSGAKKNVKDIKVVGNGDMFQLLCKASSEAEGWMKSTKAMPVGDGCLVQVTTQQRNPDGSYAIAESLTHVPNCKTRSDENSGRKLVPITG